MTMSATLIINMERTQISRSSTTSRMMEDEGGSRHGHKEILCSFVEAYQHLGKAFNRVCFHVKGKVNDSLNVVDL